MEEKRKEASFSCLSLRYLKAISVFSKTGSIKTIDPTKVVAKLISVPPAGKIVTVIVSEVICAHPAGFQGNNLQKDVAGVEKRPVSKGDSGFLW